MRYPAIVIEPRPMLRVGQRVKFADTKRRWTVRAVTKAGRFVILTQPFNLQRTVLYTVVDFDRGVRGRDDHYGLGYETDEQVADTLEAFQATEDDLPMKRAATALLAGEESWPSVFAAEVSYRHHIRLDFEAIDDQPTDWRGLPTNLTTTTTLADDAEETTDA